MQAMAVRIRNLGFELINFNMEWICAVPGVMSQKMREEALSNARMHLFARGAQNNVSHCLNMLGEHAVEIQNHRDHATYYLELRLRIFAIIHWLLENRTENIRTPIEHIAQKWHCPEITAILRGESIA